MTGTTSNEQKQCSKKLNEGDICTDSYFICFWHEWMREKKLFLCSFHFFLLHFLDLISLPTCHASTHLFFHRNHQKCSNVNRLKSQSMQEFYVHKRTKYLWKSYSNNTKLSVTSVLTVEHGMEVRTSSS